ncbi:substrate-binding periplasmic protein [Yoonia sp. R2331]|uniref:substrate-binding periplasmic protein n=1 Tax=Yoonia sp. R2331 TaxID=3237238 RepID=UPI0034E3F1D7
MTMPALARAEALVVATGEYSPYTGEQLENGGFVNETVAEIAKNAGYEPDFRFMPWRRGLEAVRRGTFHASSFWYFSEERNADFIHVGPVSSERLVFFHRTDRTLPDWQDLSDLSGLRIGAVPEFTYTPELWELAENGTLTVVTAPTDEANLKKLMSGRIDLFPMSEMNGLRLIEELFSGQERAQLTVHPNELVETQGYLLVSRAIPDAEAVAAALQSALDDLPVESIAITSALMSN